MGAREYANRLKKIESVRGMSVEIASVDDDHPDFERLQADAAKRGVVLIRLNSAGL